jgi:outer membrane protein assembly factor BamE (lipoprotein component of BamABCDE complex)
MNKSRVMTAAFMAAVFCASCSYKTGRDINTAAIDDVIIGQTTKQQVEQMFGPPSNLMMMQNGESWTYATSKMDIRGSNFIPYANLFHRESGHQQASLQVSFDRRGIVTDCAYTTSTAHHQGGLAHNNETVYQQVASGKRCGEAAAAAAEAEPVPAAAPASSARKGGKQPKASGPVQAQSR